MTIGALGGELLHRLQHTRCGIRLVQEKPSSALSISPTDAIAHRLGRVDADRHLGQLVLDHAELGDGLAERLALLGVLERLMQNCSSHPPTANGPSFRRPIFRMLNAMMWPRPISPSTFSTGTLTLSKKTAVVELPLMPIFFSSAPGVTPGQAALHQERGELLAADFGEHREQVRRAAVGDPHLLAVEDVVRAVGAQVGAGLARPARRNRPAAR